MSLILEASFVFMGVSALIGMIGITVFVWVSAISAIVNCIKERTGG